MPFSIIRIVSAATVICFSLGMAGCTFNYSIKAELLPAESSTAMVHKAPTTVGLYINPRIRSYAFSRGAGRVQAGAQLASTFQWAVLQLFEKVVILDTRPSIDRFPIGLAGVIELSDVELNEGYAPIRYEIVIHDALDNKTATWSLVGATTLWDVERSSLSATFQEIGTGLTYGIRNQTAKFMVELPNQIPADKWFKETDVQMPVMQQSLASRKTDVEKPTGILILPNLIDWRYTDNANAINCVGNRLSALSPSEKLILLDNAFRLQFFPWLEPSTGPKSIEEFRALLTKPTIKKEMRLLGIRYLLSYAGGTTTNVRGGSMFCGAGFGAGGCMGFSWGNRESSFSASIIDLYEERNTKETTSKATSGVYVPAFGLPVPLMAPTESIACEELANRIHELISVQGNGL